MYIMQNPIKRTVSATPAQLLGDVRQAQATHADEIAAANARFTDAAQGIYAEVANRRQVVQEQIQLLQAEDAGLVEVKAAAESTGVIQA